MSQGQKSAKKVSSIIWMAPYLQLERAIFLQIAFKNLCERFDLLENGPKSCKIEVIESGCVQFPLEDVQIESVNQFDFAEGIVAKINFTNSTIKPKKDRPF